MHLAAVLGSASQLLYLPVPRLQNGDGATSRHGVPLESALKGKGEQPDSYSRPTDKQQFGYVCTAISLALLSPHLDHL